MTERFEVALVGDAILGETPVWDPVDKVLYWVDIVGEEVHRYDPSDGTDSRFNAGASVGCVALANTGLIFAAGSQIIQSDVVGARRVASNEIFSDRRVRFNDGRVDPSGRFYVGTMDLSERDPLGALYCFRSDGAPSKVLDSLVVSNGLDFSDDGSVLYHIDSPKRIVKSYGVDATDGHLSHPRILFEIAESLGEPDGLVIDAQGCLWISMWGGGKVIRFDSRGSILDSVALPVSQPTGITFGGTGLDELYVCSAREGLDAEQLAKEPLAGSIFRIPLSVPGRPTHLFGRSSLS